MEEQAGQDDLGLWVGTVLKNEMRQVDRAGLSGRPGVWLHAECMGAPCKFVSRVWQDPSGCCVENGLLGGRGDEGDEGVRKSTLYLRTTEFRLGQGETGNQKLRDSEKLAGSMD